MFREATMFAGHLRTVEKDLAAWARDVDSEFWGVWLAGRRSPAPPLLRAAAARATRFARFPPPP